MDNSEHTIFIFSTHDVSSVQGTTEAYYVCKEFSKQFETHLVSPSSKPVGEATSYSYPLSGILGLLVLNVFMMPYWIRLGIKEEPSLIYTYRNVFLPPVVLKLLVGSQLVCDFQVHPVDQPKEFNKDTLFNRMFVSLSWIAHAFLIQFSDVVITLSKPLAQSLSDNFNVSEEQIYVVPLGVDTNMFDPSIKNSAGGLKIAYMGSIKRHRGVESILSGLDQLPKESQEQITVELFGPAPEDYIAEIESTTDNKAYSLLYHGLIPHESVPDQVGSCDCAVSPLPPHEGFEVSSPAKIYEYLALGMPIIATKITPHERLLEHNHDSLLVAPNSPDEMAAAIEKLLTDETFRQKLGQNARSKSIRNDWEDRIEMILDAVSTETDLKL